MNEQQDFLNEVAQSLDRMDEDVRVHFRLLTRMLLACYLDDTQRAAIFSRAAKANRLHWYRLTLMTKRSAK